MHLRQVRFRLSDPLSPNCSVQLGATMCADASHLAPSNDGPFAGGPGLSVLIWQLDSL